jgi:glycosyltransferase involved in cell wall biosynthesis
MKSVLMIAYWFPPEGNAAVYRPLRFLRNLPVHGWTGRVIAGAPYYERYDADLLRLVPQGTEIIRTRDTDLWQAFQRRRGERLKLRSSRSGTAAESVDSAPTARAGRSVRVRLRTLVRKAESCWYHPDMQRPWIRHAVSAAVATSQRHRPDVLWATGPPWSSFVVARRVSDVTGIPYVLDFRTSWTIVPSPFEAIRPRWAQRADGRRLRELLRNAQAVCFFYRAEAECFWRLYRDALDVSRIHVIPNGFDGEVERTGPPHADRFTILYAGTLSDYGYEAFVDALARFIQRDPTRAQTVRVQFIGEEEPTLRRRVEMLGLSAVVSTKPPVPHGEVAALQRHASVLLMLERKPSHKGYELLAGAKLFNYLKAGRPILGVVPHGEASRILRDVGVTTVANASSIDETCAALETLYNAWTERRLASFAPDPAACSRYSAASQTALLVRALEGAAPPEPFVPGAEDIVPSLRAEFAAAGLA